MNYYSDNKALQHYLRHPLLQRIVAMKERDYAHCKEYDYAPVDFAEAVEGYEQVLNLVGELCAEYVAPNAVRTETEGPSVENGRVIYAPGTEENLQLFRQAGLMGISLPRKFGGLNFPTAIFTMIQDVVCRADAAFGNL